jgi:hypothetical protein
MPNLTIRLSEEDMGILDRLSAQWNMTRSDAVRKLIRSFDNALREVREEACRTCSRLAAAYLFESMLLNPMVIYNLINSNRDLVGDHEFIVGWIVTSDHRVFFSTMDDLGRWLLGQAKEHARKYYEGKGSMSARNRQIAAKPPARAGAPTPKGSTGGSCYKIVVAYPDGSKRDVAEVLTKGCKNEEDLEVSLEDYEGYLRNELTLDDLVRRSRKPQGSTNTAASGGSSTQSQPQQGKQQAAQAGVSAYAQGQPSNPQQLQQNKQTDLRNLPYLTLGEIAVRLGVLKLPNNNNRDRGAGGGI